MSEIQFKNADSTDLEFIYSCICDLENSNFDKTAFTKIFNSLLSDTHFSYIIAIMDQVNAGFISLRIEEQLHHAAKIAEIMELYVVPAFRNQSVGKLLVEKANHIAIANGCIQLEVDTNQSRLDAIRFYEQCGFNVTHVKSVRKQ